MHNKTILVICAATGDASAWQRLLYRSQVDRKRTAALLLLDNEPPPLATLLEFIALGGSDCALEPGDAAFLRRLPAHYAAAQIGEAGASMPLNTRKAPLDCVMRDPVAIWRVVKHAWDALNDHERVTLARNAAKHREEMRAIALPQRLSAMELMTMTEEDRAALIRSAPRKPDAAARDLDDAAQAIASLGAKGFAALDDTQRAAPIRSATFWTSNLAFVIKRLGAGGVETLTAPEQAMIIKSAIE